LIKRVTDAVLDEVGMAVPGAGNRMYPIVHFLTLYGSKIVTPIAHGQETKAVYVGPLASQSMAGARGSRSLDR